MMWQEFEELAGYEVSYKDYHEIIEPMYMAVPQISKQEFVKMIDKKRFALKTKAQIIREMKKLAKEIREVVEHNGAYELKEKLRKLAKEYASRFWSFDPNNTNDYWYFNVSYTIPELMRGCSFPVELVIGRDIIVYERIKLLKA